MPMGNVKWVDGHLVATRDIDPGDELILDLDVVPAEGVRGVFNFDVPATLPISPAIKRDMDAYVDAALRAEVERIADAQDFADSYDGRRMMDEMDPRLLDADRIVVDGNLLPAEALMAVLRDNIGRPARVEVADGVTTLYVGDTTDSSS